jgi:hypothetical protein
MGEYADSLKKRKSTKASEAVEAAREAAAKEKERLAKAKAQEKRDAARSSGRNSPISSQYPTYTPPDPIVIPQTGNKGKKEKGPSEQQQVTVISAPVQTGLVDNINIKEEYQREARRIILSLVKSAKDLLIKYNFSSIDRVAEYALDSDREAKTEYVVSQKSRPEPPFTPSEAAMQDRFSQDIIQISNSISDMVDDSVKLSYFGIIQGSQFIAGKPRISNGVSSYDMKLTIDTVSDKTFVIKCYEIS